MPYKQIRSKKTYCLDVANGSKRNRAPLISFPCHSGPNQKFSYKKRTKQLVVKSSKKCVDLVKNRLVQNKCNTRKISQQWKYNPKNKHWISLKNRKCVDVNAGIYDKGYVITYPCHNGENQKWKK